MVTSVLDHVLFRLRSITTFHCTFQRHLKLMFSMISKYMHMFLCLIDLFLTFIFIKYRSRDLVRWRFYFYLHVKVYENVQS